MIVNLITEITPDEQHYLLKKDLKIFRDYEKIFDLFQKKRREILWFDKIIDKFRTGLYSDILRTYFGLDRFWIKYTTETQYKLLDGNNNNAITKVKQVKSILSTAGYYPLFQHKKIGMREKLRVDYNHRAFLSCFDRLKTGGNLMITIFNFTKDESYKVIELGLILFQKAYLCSMDIILFCSFQPKISKNTFIKLMKKKNKPFIPSYHLMIKHYSKCIKLLTNMYNFFLNNKVDKFLDSFADQLFQMINKMSINALVKNELKQKTMHILKRIPIKKPIKFNSGINMQEGKTIQTFIKKTPGKLVLEIGMAFGISTFHICSSLKKTNGLCVSIDPFQKTQWNNNGVKLIRNNNLNAYHRLIKKKSYIALPELLKKKERYDLVFIDGWHTFDYTLIDFFYADKLLCNNGYILVDDIRHRGVKACMNYISSNYSQYRQIKIDVSTMICFQKIREDSREWNFHVTF